MHRHSWLSWYSYPNDYVSDYILPVEYKLTKPSFDESDLTKRNKTQVKCIYCSSRLFGDYFKNKNKNCIFDAHNQEEITNLMPPHYYCKKNLI